MFRVNQVVELKEEFKTPTCKKGVCLRTFRNYAAYKILSIKNVNCVAFNMGTLMVQTLRMEHLTSPTWNDKYKKHNGNAINLSK